jgi:hypothetical protein
MDIIWIEHLGSWRALTPKYTLEIWEINGGYSWAAYNANGEYVFAGHEKYLDAAKREAVHKAC